MSRAPTCSPCGCGDLVAELRDLEIRAQPAHQPRFSSACRSRLRATRRVRSSSSAAPARPTCGPRASSRRACRRVPQDPQAVGLEHRPVDLVVDVLQDGDQPGLVDVLFHRAQGFLARPALQLAQPLQHVVEPGHGEEVVRRQTLLAERVEAFSERAQAVAERGLRVVVGEAGVDADGEGEGVEDSGLAVARVVAYAKPAAGRQCPAYMQPRRQHGQMRPRCRSQYSPACCRGGCVASRNWKKRCLAVSMVVM